MATNSLNLEAHTGEVHQLMIDWHCHILPGLDDGAKSPDESLAIARELVATGFSTVYCTPHCMRGVFETTPAQVRERVPELQAELDREGIDLRLEPGMEYSLDEFFPDELDRLLPLGETRMVLLESPNPGDPQHIKEMVFQVSSRRYIPLIAHPERHDFMVSRQTSENTGLLGRLKHRIAGRQAASSATPDLSDDLRQMGCRFQGNLGSFAGIYGKEVKHRAEKFFMAPGYDYLGSDAHRADSLGKMLERGLARLKGSFQ